MQYIICAHIKRVYFCMYFIAFFDCLTSAYALYVFHVLRTEHGFEIALFHLYEIGIGFIFMGLHICRSQAPSHHSCYAT